MPFGVTATGFVRKRLADIRTDLEAAVRAEFGPGAVVTPDGAFAKLIGVVAKPLADLWELAEAVYGSSYPSLASGASLDNVVELNGLERLPADASVFWARFDGTSGTSVPIGQVVEHPQTRDRFSNLAAVSILSTVALRADCVLLPPVAPATTYAAGTTWSITADGEVYTHTIPGGGQTETVIAAALAALVEAGPAITGLNRAAQQVTVLGDRRRQFIAGTSAVVTGTADYNGTYTVRSATFSAGSTTVTFEQAIPGVGGAAGRVRGSIRATASAGTCRLDVTQPAAADNASLATVAVSVSSGGGAPAGRFSLGTVGSPARVTASATGARDVAAGTAFTLLSGVSGWTGLVAALSADVGRALESDADLRIRRRRSLSFAGRATVEAIRARLLALEGVDAVTVIDNDTDGVVAGRPPHSFESIVSGGNRQQIARTIWETKPAGIATTGNTSETWIDSMGYSHAILFSRPVDVLVHVRVTVTALYAEEVLPADAANLIAAAVVAYGESLGTGVDVIAARFLGPVFTAVPGIQSMTILVDRDGEGGVPPPASAIEAIAPAERGRFATSRVVVVLP